MEGNRSGLWHHIVAAIQALNPCLVVIENVRGLLTSPAAAGAVESCPWCVGDAAGQPAVRALGAVLGSLADLGRDARWCVLPASDVGAPHRRERLFLASWRRGDAAEDTDQQPRHERREPAPGETQGRRARSEPGRRNRVATCSEGVRRNQGLAASAPRRPGTPLSGSAAPPRLHGREHLAGPEGDALRDLDGPRRLPGTWGRYAEAVARWEMLTRPAPPPTDDAGRLSPRFVEWMQGLEDGWVTATPGLGRPAQLAALGNGVVPQQAAHALRLLAPPIPGCQHRGHE